MLVYRVTEDATPIVWGFMWCLLPCQWPSALCQNAKNNQA